MDRGEPVIKRLPLAVGHPFTMKEKESNSFFKDANKCRGNNGIRKSLFVKHHSDNYY